MEEELTPSVSFSFFSVLTKCLCCCWLQAEQGCCQNAASLRTSSSTAVLFFCPQHWMHTLLLLASSRTRLLSKCSIPQNLIFNCGFILLSTALDAYVLLELYDHLCKVARDNKMDINLEPRLSLKWLNPSKNERRKVKAMKKAQKVNW